MLQEINQMRNEEQKAREAANKPQNNLELICSDFAQLAVDGQGLNSSMIMRMH